MHAEIIGSADTNEIPHGWPSSVTDSFNADPLSTSVATDPAVVLLVPCLACADASDGVWTGAASASA